jgi:hypothetical protein
MVGKIFLCYIDSACIIYNTHWSYLKDGLNLQRGAGDGHGEPHFGILIELSENAMSRRI